MIADLEGHAQDLDRLAASIEATLRAPGCDGVLARHLTLTCNNLRFEALVLRRAAEIHAAFDAEVQPWAWSKG
jgi:hypothetical protein